MMNKKYVPIDSVDDIDLSKISIANINDRYIDKKGNRFATRFNLRTKKIQIVRIALGEDEAARARGKVVQGLVKKKLESSIKKKTEEEHTGSGDDLAPPDISEIGSLGGNEKKTTPTGDEVSGKKFPEKRPIPEWIPDLGIEPAASVNPGDLLAVLEENYKLLAERLFGVINNIKNSGVMKATAEIDEAIDFTNIYDHKIEPKMNEAKKYKNELLKYAERPDHYYTMIEKAYRVYLHDLSDPEIMEFLKAYFIGSLCFEVLGETLGFIQTVKEKTKDVNMELLESDKRQFLGYAYTTCDFLTSYIKEEAAKLLRWMIDEKIY